MRRFRLRQRRYSKTPTATLQTAAMAIPAFAPIERPLLPFVPLSVDGAEVVSNILWVSNAILSPFVIDIVLATLLSNVSRLTR